MAAFSNLLMRSDTVFIIWYIRFLAYMLIGAGYGFLVHLVPLIRTNGKWVYNWKKAILWGWLPILLPIWFTLYYQGIVGFMPVHLLRGVPNIPLYNIMGFLLGSSLTACLKKSTAPAKSMKKVYPYNSLAYRITKYFMKECCLTKKRVATIICVFVFYALLILVCASDVINFQRVLALFSNHNIRSVFIVALWYYRFLVYVLLGAGYGFVVHTLPVIKTHGEWRYDWRTAILWGILPALMPIWFTLYYQGIVSFMPVHLLRGVPNIPLYNIMGLILGITLISCLKKQRYGCNSV